MGVRMKFLSVSDLRSKSAEVWKELPAEREMIITSNGRPIAILAAISESNFEETLSAFRQARAVEAVASIQRRSADKGTDKITMDEIDEEIKAIRKKKSVFGSDQTNSLGSQQIWPYLALLFPLELPFSYQK